MTYAPPYMAGNGIRTHKNCSNFRATPRCLDSTQGSTASPSLFFPHRPLPFPNCMADGTGQQKKQYLHTKHCQWTRQAYSTAARTGTGSSAKLLINLCITLLTTLLIAPCVINTTQATARQAWISTGLLKAFHQVFNTFLAEKDINLLILHRVGRLLINIRLR